MSREEILDKVLKQRACQQRFLIVLVSLFDYENKRECQSNDYTTWSTMEQISD